MGDTQSKYSPEIPDFFYRFNKWINSLARSNKMKDFFQKYCTELRVRSEYYTQIIDDLLIPLTPKIDFQKSDFTSSPSIYAFKLCSISLNIPITIVFWEDQIRVSIFLEDYEATDDYLDKPSEKELNFSFLLDILSSPINKTICTDKKGNIKKLFYEYLISDSHGKKIYQKDFVINKPLMPWQDLEKNSFNYDPWIEQSLIKE